ncbi:MAG: helix-turn-helix transcriptional regulator [Gracilimonas sp.]|uniref:ArsR/SmtB family transcription factor n=1 Tax=Gracilimonas TaxID=649462 RepID=UPI001B172F0F|nr:metalloregulator ArsR/SmtB family transcription factor [Gracilimonas sp.]MBO6585939.1 helix-turn-helix transcriptional regulator [Gracilimonas sp.]MBO6616936.1 helix-turn-helix transcriptional regulator [Gracilimonas sp.]
MSQDVFQAIADPTRRQIIDLLAGQSLPVNDVAEKFDMSRPAVSKHLKILNECGLVVIKQQGRKRFCRADTRKLQDVMEWTQRYRKFWNKKLDTLEALLNDIDETSS